MEFDLFKILIPSQYITFAIPNTIYGAYLRAPLLRIAVLDSPEAKADDDYPRIATMIVPENKELDWLFCTEFGHYQLLFHFEVSRLILIGNNLNPNTESSIYIRPPVVDCVDMGRIVGELKQIVIRYYPQVCIRNGWPEPLFGPYDNDMIYRAILERFVGPCVGEFVVEDVVLEREPSRRGLRFKSMPYLIQSQVPLIPRISDDESDFEFDLQSLTTRSLIEPYLNCMVSGIFLIASPLYERMKQGISPRALCLGVGGGSLLTFLNSQLGFQVVGVEIDEVVLSAARKYFGLYDAPSLKLIVGDAIKLVEKHAHDPNVYVDGLNIKFDVVMVDLVSNEARLRTTSPSPRFARSAVLQATRSLLHDHGVVIIHVVPPDARFYVTLIPKLKGVFHKVYELSAKTGQSFVLIATLTPLTFYVNANAFSERLVSVIFGSFMDTLREL